MADYHETGTSIECSKCEIITRKFVPSMPLIDPILGKVIKYELSRNASAEILEELIPKKAKMSEVSKLSLHDKIVGEGLTAIVQTLKRPRTEVINQSGRHKANQLLFNCFTFAQIKNPLINVLNSMQKRINLK